MAKLYISYIFITLYFLIFFHASSSSSSSSSLPSGHSTIPLLSLRSNPINQTGAYYRCTFRVQIRTSCSSVSYTRDQISISFGDAYGNQVYAPRIDDPYSRAFEACSTDTYDIDGPCTYDVCYVYLYRSGYDGWKVDSVRISSPYIRTVNFYFNGWIPNDVWWGFNYCNGSSSNRYNKPPLSTLIIVTLVALLFSATDWRSF